MFGERFARRRKFMKGFMLKTREFRFFNLNSFSLVILAFLVYVYFFVNKYIKIKYVLFSVQILIKVFICMC